MIIKLKKILNCSSEHPEFPASNLLHNPPPGPWKCTKPGELLATVTFELPESTCIIGLDIGNFRSCIVVVTASTSTDPDNWVPVVNHQFMTHDEASNNKFKDQVQLFTKTELNSDTLKIKFDRVKVTCMQSANLRELFGLSFFILRTEVVVDIGIDVFGRFKLKKEETEKTKSDFKEKYLRLFPEKQKSFKDDLVEKIKEETASRFDKRQEEVRAPKKRPLLEKLEAGKTEEVFGKKTTQDNLSVTAKYPSTNGKLNEVARTPFGDIIQPTNSKNEVTPQSKKKLDDDGAAKKKRTESTDDKDNDDEIGKAGPSHQQNRNSIDSGSAKQRNTPKRKLPEDIEKNGNKNMSPNDTKCTECSSSTQNQICKVCKKLSQPILKTDTPKPKKPRVVVVPKKAFSKLFEDVRFSLSGYVNPQRDDIRRKALQMGGRYIVDPNTTNNKCTHLICAFSNTPKLQQLKGHTKIVTNSFIEDCFNHRKRYPWRKYALIKKDKDQPESEEEIEGSTSPVRPQNPYDQDTDDSDTDY